LYKNDTIKPIIKTKVSGISETVRIGFIAGNLAGTGLAALTMYSFLQPG